MDALTAPAEGEVVLWDDKLAGFGVRVRPGGAKTYLVIYRAGSGRGAPLRKVVIGKHGTWTPDAARSEARKILGAAAGGGDPAAEKAEKRKASTLAELADRFLVEHVQAKRKDRTAAEYRRLLDKIVLPALGKKKVVDITRADIAKLHHAGRDAPYQANRVLAVLGKMFNLAEGWNIRPDNSNPCRHVEKFPETARERLLSPVELARLGDALAGYDGSPYVSAAIKLLLFTGARLGEILGLRWSDIDFERGEAWLAEFKNSRTARNAVKVLHLPPPALAVLADLPRIEGNPHVIAGQKDGAALVNLEKP